MNKYKVYYYKPKPKAYVETVIEADYFVVHGSSILFFKVGVTKDILINAYNDFISCWEANND